MFSVLVDNFKRSYLLPFLMKSYNNNISNRVSMEMIIVDDNSNDDFTTFLELGTKHIKPKFPIKAFQTNKPTTYNPAKALNIAFKQSVGEIIILNHSDIIPHSNHILQSFTDEFNIPEPETTDIFPDVIVPHFIFSMITLDTYPGMLNNGVAMKREIYERMRGHDERFCGGPSVDFDLMNRIRTHNSPKFNVRWFKEDKSISYLHIGYTADAGIRFRDYPPEWRESFSYPKEEHSYDSLRDYNNSLVTDNVQNNTWINLTTEWGTLDTLQKVYESSPI